MNWVKQFIVGICLFVGLLAGSVGHAGQLDKPKGKVILRVDGKITNTNNGSVAEFDRQGLEALGMTSITTKTPWHNNAIKFEGVSLQKLMEVVGAQGTSVKVIALNDYVAPIPFDDFKRFDPIIALKRDGEYMTVRDKGPLFIVYPYDKDLQLQNQTYYTRSVWQLRKLTVE
ncbi:oxidoreductase [Daeguia caeni]|uniref:Oxidoreductase n=1 Tax=Daeguia caeni TaxID=439612 RepID=A0ABV9H1D2_9HYPH